MSRCKYTDKQLIEAVKKANCITDVAVSLGVVNRSIVKKKMVALGLHNDLIRFENNVKSNCTKAANLIRYLDKNAYLVQDVIAGVEESLNKEDVESDEQPS